MKKCKKCKREVTGKEWAYKDDLCKGCYYQRRYLKERPELTKMILELEKKSKEQLIRTILSYQGNRANVNMLFAKKNWQIKHFRDRLRKIRNQIDYLLEHPYSLDTSYKTKPHKRDTKFRKENKN